MHRRAFIQISAYTAAVLTLPFVNGCAPKPIDAEAQPLFFSHIVDVKTILAAGLAYRKANQAEDDSDKLKGLLLAANGLSPQANQNTIKDRLDRQVNNDFETGNIAVVDGWVLSITEARQCALFSILQA